MKKAAILNLHWKEAIAPTAVAVLITLVTLYLFGLINTLIAPFATLSYLRFMQMKCHYPCMLKHYLVYCVIIVAAWAANISPVLCVLADIGVFFGMAYIIIDEYEPTNYFPFGMAMIFFQFAPVEGVYGMLDRSRPEDRRDPETLSELESIHMGFMSELLLSME